MAQLTNTRVYGTLDVDKVVTAKSGINVTPLKNNTDTEDNSAKITLNSVIVDDKQSSANNENKLSSIKLTSVNNVFGKIETTSSASYPIQNNSLYSYAAEFKNNAGKLLSLDLRTVNSEEHKTFDASGRVKTYDIDKYDRTFSIDLSVSENYTEADAETPNFNSDRITSTYTSSKTEKPADATTGSFSGDTNNTKTTINVPLTVPYEGGEIITDETCDKNKIARQYYVKISNTAQLTRLLNAKTSPFKKYVDNTNVAMPGVILYAVLHSTGILSNGERYKYAKPVYFYCASTETISMCELGSNITGRSSLSSNESLYIIFSTKTAADEIEKAIA